MKLKEVFLNFFIFIVTYIGIWLVLDRGYLATVVSSKLKLKEIWTQNFSTKWTPYFKQGNNTTGEKECKPVKNLVFIKVAKCGGSTISNILLRYGEKNNLTFLLPERGSIVSRESFYKHMGEKINMIVHHTTFHEARMKRLMPKDTIYIGVIREPLNQMKSYYNYHNYANDSTKPSLAQFEENPWKYINSMGEVLNHQSRWYGWENKKTMNEKMAWEFVDKINKTFHLMLVTDHMKESLLLLQELLCWTIDDMLFVSHKIATEIATAEGTEGLKVVKIGNSDHAPNRTLAELNLRQFSRVDYNMFDFFNNTLWEKINTRGNIFKEKMKQYNEKLNKLKKTCRYTPESLVPSMEFIKRVFHESPSSPDYRCHRMLLSPNLYSKYILYPKQNKKYTTVEP